MSPRPFRWVRLATVAPIVLATACGIGDLVAPHQGKVAITVKWPAKTASRYALAAIPDSTARVEVTILGEGIPGDAPLHTTIVPNGQEDSTDFIEVPIGPKVVEAFAFDASNHEVAHGERAIAVLPNQLTEAHVELQPENLPVPVTTPTPGPSDLAGSPTPSPSPTPTPPQGPTIVTIAGGDEAAVVDNTNAALARFHYPRSLAYDRSGRVLYIADNDNHLIRTYDLVSHAVNTVAHLGGTSGTTGTSGLGAAAGLALGPDGALYYADTENNVIRKLNPDGTINVIAGTGHAGADDGPGAAASFNYPVALAFGVDGYLYVADELNNKIRRINMRDPALGVSTFVGTGAGGYQGDAGPALQATIDLPDAIAISPSGSTLYIAEARGHRIRKVQLGTGIIDTAAGNGTTGVAGEGGNALYAALSLPLGLAFDNLGHLYIADGWGTHVGATGSLTGVASRVLRLETDGRLVRVAGLTKGVAGFSGDNGPAILAELDNPTGLAFDELGNLFISDTYNNRLREILAEPPSPSPTPVPTPAPTDTATPVASPVPLPSPTPTAIAPSPSPQPSPAR